jgi:SARP family transcriptional regulator, regulator of embCAB operon
VGNAEAMDELARVQLCGTFAVDLLGRRIDNILPGRQGRLLFAYLALSRLQPVSRSTLIDALWGDDRPADAGGALSALISKTRGVVGGDVLRGRTELTLALPEPAHVDVEVALAMLHTAESAVAVGAWRRAWAPALSALVRRTPYVHARGGDVVGGGLAAPPGRCTGPRPRVLRRSLP